MPMPNRHIQDANAYRYAYQGQEKDPETGKEAFQLRLWDGRIGRWLTTDPYGQFFSPYIGMGNSPVKFIDLDGGYCQDSDGNSIPCPDGYGSFEGPTVDTHTFEQWDDGTWFYNNPSNTVDITPSYLDVFRDIQTDNSTTSTFTFGNVSGFILEPSGPDTTTPNQDLRIPEGTYNLVNHNTTSHPNSFKLYNDSVSQNRAILIHSGNYPKHTEGCLLPGCSRGTDAVWSSKTKVSQLFDALNEKSIENIRVRIHNNFPPPPATSPFILD